jgi:hypothetical protein
MERTMKKLHLRVEEITVESFQLNPGMAGRGTVRANAEPGCMSYDNPMCTEGCTEYCETDGGGRGYTCDGRCHTRNTNCDCSGPKNPFGTVYNDVTCVNGCYSGSVYC